MKKFICSLAVLISASFAANAQLTFVGYAEYGYSFFKYKSDELQVFLTDYNETYALATPFPMKMGAARGPYYKIGVGIGDSKVMMVLDLAIYEVKTNPIEARFPNGTGRDLWVEHRNSNTNIGIRFGGSKQYPAWIQFDMCVSVQTTSIYLAYVYADGSRSLGNDKTLNGVYSNFAGLLGLGLTAGYRIIGPLGFNVSANYMFSLVQKPEYHQYTDLNNVKPEMTPDYIPRDNAMYTTDPFNGTENSISNDMRGWKFNAGLILMIGNWED
ncbi:MAG TPA: hypothetical protein VK826_15010 [Bacteroidia bacterium]|nr:hypothetical protein [Bacteroidia bacterium]